jgi:hypothetical protein
MSKMLTARRNALKRQVNWREDQHGVISGARDATQAEILALQEEPEPA